MTLAARAARCAAGLAMLAAAGCTSEGLNPIVGAIYGEVAGLVRPAAPEAPAAPRQVLSRADIEAAGTAAIRARVIEGGQPTLLFAAAQNGPYVTFASALRQTLTLRGSQLTATRGLGADLLSATSSNDDPLVRPTPPQNWPSRVERRYEFPADAPRGRVEAYQCTFAFDEPRTISILTVEHRGVEVTETCRGADGEFQNLHFVEFGTGIVWRSIQWTGPEQSPIDVEIITRFAARGS